MVEKIKDFIAKILDFIGILNILFSKCYKDKQVIRVINYHRTPDSELETFKKQIEFYSKYFENIDYLDFEKFMNGEKKLEKPGVILSFDDGLLNNYQNAAKILEEYHFTGWFFVSTGLHEGKYMSYSDMKDLLQRNHVIGCHTYTHHRMDEQDTDELLNKEIIVAKEDLEKAIDHKVDIFCWCGGEENTYTKKANQKIQEVYKWAFMTNSELVTSKTDHHFLERTNVEARWSLSLMKFQLSGIMDYLYKGKRDRVKQKLIG